MGRKKRRTPEETKVLRAELLKLHEEGIDQTEMGRRYDLDSSTISRHLKAAGITPRKKLPADASIEERLAEGTGPVEPDTGCMHWTRSVAPQGYGRLIIPVKQIAYAHRIALEIRLGRKLVEGEQARHTCDNRICVNPDHLIPGTAADNARDAVERNRYKCTEGRPEKQVRAKELEDLGWTQRRIAADIGVSQRTICVWLAATRNA